MVTESNTSQYAVRMNFLCDDGSDYYRGEYAITVSGDVTAEQVQKILKETHSRLVMGDEDCADVYNMGGCNPEALIDYVCQKNGWRYEKIEYDIDIDLD